MSLVLKTVARGSSILALILGLSVGSMAFAGKGEPKWNPSVANRSQEVQPALRDFPEGQRDLINAVQNHRGMNFVEVADVKVVKILPDDEDGRRHQKWVFELANGTQVIAIYNTDVSERVQLREGDEMSAGGQYIWDKGGGLLHWLHEDTKNHRPDGYVVVEGVRYGDVSKENRR